MGLKKTKSEEREENVLSVLQFRFAPYWPLFLILFIVAGIGASVYMRYATPMYQASASILIKDKKKGVDDGKALESLDIIDSKKLVENEMVIIRSRTLMEEVVKGLHLYASIYEKGKLRDAIAYVSAPVSIVAKNPEQLENTEPIPFSYNKEKGLVTIEGKQYPTHQYVETPYGELKFVKNEKAYREPGGPLYFILRKPENVAPSLTGRVNIKPTNKIATVLDLYYVDESPERAKDVLNKLIEAYAINTVNEKNALASNTLNFIEERLGYVTRDLDSIERTIQRYKSQQGIVDLSEQGRVFLQNVSDADRQTTNINMQLSVLEQVEGYVVSKNNQTGMVPATLGLNDPVLSELLTKLYNSELEYNKLRQTMAENNPAVVAVAKDIENIRPSILEIVNNQKQGLIASRSNLQQASGMYNSMLRSIPQKERQLLEISRQQAIKNSVYSFLLQKREETALSASAVNSDSRLIDPAIARYTPVSPKKTIAYMGALVVALLIGVAIVVAKELLTGKILFRNEIESYTQVPIVAEITNVKHKSPLVVNQPDKVFIAEQFRHLRAAIGLYGKVITRKRILVTSSIPGEGKSFVASNLALSLAISGKKVVLLDADLRGPRTSSTFNLLGKPGLADYLEQETSLSAVSYTTEHPNLQVIPAGRANNNPTELLLNGNLSELFATLERSFDYIIIDTSPIDPVTDAYVFSDFCDRTLYIVRHGYTPKTMVQLLDESNKIKALKNLAIVFNGVKKRGFFKGNYGYGYGFGYEYVYKNREEQKGKGIKPSLN